MWVKKTPQEKVLARIKDLDNMFQQRNKIDILAASYDVEIKDNSFFKKMKQVTMLYFMLWADKSNRHMIEMMINGTVMGIVDTIKAEKDLKTENEELNAMVVEFKKMQEDFYEKLKKQLAKV